MLKVLYSSQAAEWGSAALVFLSGAIVGREASLGMSMAQWSGGIAAVLGSVALAVMVRAWPAPAKAQAEGRRAP
jgi:hypothetical protein